MHIHPNHHQEEHRHHGHPSRDQLRRAMQRRCAGEGQLVGGEPSSAAADGRTSSTSRSPRRTSTASPSSTSSPRPSRSRPRRESESADSVIGVVLMPVPRRACRRRSTRSNCSSTTRSSPRCVCVRVEHLTDSNARLGALGLQADVQETKRLQTSRAVVLVLRKKEPKSEYWPRLTKEKPNRNWIKTDFSKVRQRSYRVA